MERAALDAKSQNWRQRPKVLSTGLFRLAELVSQARVFWQQEIARLSLSETLPAERIAELHVRGQPDVVLEVRETRRGPVIGDIAPERDGKLLAVAMASLAPGTGDRRGDGDRPDPADAGCGRLKRCRVTGARRHPGSRASAPVVAPRRGG